MHNSSDGRALVAADSRACGLNPAKDQMVHASKQHITINNPKISDTVNKLLR